MSTEWWGHSQQHGWVVLDRTIEGNGPGARGELMFVRCLDSELVFESAERWQPPEYRFETAYLQSLPAAERVEAQDQLRGHKVQLKQFQAVLAKEVRDRQDRKVAEKRKARASRSAAVLEHEMRMFLRGREQFFLNLGMNDPGTRPAIARGRHRVTHCYSCKTSLDNAMDAECVACGWIVCRCGACGCGYDR